MQFLSFWWQRIYPDYPSRPPTPAWASTNCTPTFQSWMCYTSSDACVFLWSFDLYLFFLLNLFCSPGLNRFPCWDLGPFSRSTSVALSVQYWFLSVLSPHALLEFLLCTCFSQCSLLVLLNVSPFSVWVLVLLNISSSYSWVFLFWDFTSLSVSSSFLNLFILQIRISFADPRLLYSILC